MKKIILIAILFGLFSVFLITENSFLNAEVSDHVCVQKCKSIHRNCDNNCASQPSGFDKQSCYADCQASLNNCAGWCYQNARKFNSNEDFINSNPYLQ